MLLDLNGYSATIHALEGGGLKGGNVHLGGGTLTVSGNTGTTFSGVISESGNLTKDGTATLTLAGENTFTGTTKVLDGILKITGSLNSSGIVQVASGATLNVEINKASSSGSNSIGSITGTGSDGQIKATGTYLNIHQTTDGIFGGAITTTEDSFSLVNTGPSSLTLTGSVTTSDVILCSGNWILDGEDATIDATGYTITFNSDCSGSVPNTILTGTSSTSIYPVIDCGTLVINENTTLAGTLTVNGTVSVVGGTNSATLQPGSSPGTITVDHANFGENSVLSIYLGEGTNSDLEVLGDLVINPGSTLAFRPESTYFTPNQGFDFLSYDAITGAFETVEMGSILLLGEIEYTDTGATVTVNYQELTNIAEGANALSVAASVDALRGQGVVAGDPGLQNVIGQFIPATADEISNVLNQMQPALFKGLTISQENNAVRVRDTLSLRMRDEMNQVHCYRIAGKEEEKKCSKEEKPMHAWANGFGDILYQKSIFDAGSPQTGYLSKTGGITAGIDGHFSKYLYLGIMGGYTGSSISFSKNAGKGDIDTGYGGVYFSALGDMFYANASVIGGWSHFSADRNVFLPQETITAKHSHGGAQLLSHIDTGVNLGWEGFTVRPFDSFDYITQTENSFTETGAGSLTLNVKKNTAIMIRNELGVEFAHCICTVNGRWSIAPKLSWIREVRLKGANYTASFTVSDDEFEVEGYFPDRSLIAPGVMISGAMMNDLLTVDLYYGGEFGRKYSDHNFGLQLRFGF